MPVVEVKMLALKTSAAYFAGSLRLMSLARILARDS